MFQFWATVVVDVTKPGKAVIGPGLTERYGVHPVVKVPVKSAHISWPIPLPSSSRGELSLRGNRLTGLALAADDIPVRTQVTEFLPVATPADTRWLAAAQKSGLPRAGCHGYVTPVAEAK
jgi:hypothetical protein